jgi:hypothetical protein
VVAVPWAAWFALPILINGPRWRYLSQASWSLLIVPVGGPILLLMTAWVVAGFRQSIANASEFDCESEVKHSLPNAENAAS